LRASLFEHPRNVDSLIAMFEIHHRRGDQRRAAHYLRQALAIAPDNPLLRVHAADYAAVL
jgi:predicted Zn-dependent protease